MSVITTKPQYVSDASSVSRKSLMSVEGDMFSSHEIRGRSQIMSAKFLGFLTPSPLSAFFTSVQSTKITQPPLLHQNLGNPLPPPLCWCHLWMAPYGKSVAKRTWKFYRVSPTLTFVSQFLLTESMNTLSKKCEGEAGEEVSSKISTRAGTPTGALTKLCHGNTVCNISDQKNYDSFRLKRDPMTNLRHKTILSVGSIDVWLSIVFVVD